MAFSLRVFVLLCGISGLLTGAWSWSLTKDKDTCCPKGWTQLDDHCYIFLDENRTFADSERICNTIGGNLVSITDDLENFVVYELAVVGGASQAWIGLYDAFEDGVYFWIDGTDFDFENFAMPKSGNDTCVVIQTNGGSGEWVGESCDAGNPFVCISDANCNKH
ncbi:ladderlectin-like [Dunckerocampus dactyliophorus]|uniref:ladderlectin-like n=1 Tax=Dunckerocampus dactyliophorus TaxID=161453 RepID=UPI0024067788|nr:ladderlectin-like [Dunckerocampus dactyliophorus]